MANDNPRPWERGGSIRLIVGGFMMWLVDIMSAGMMSIHLYGPSQKLDETMDKIGVWSGLIDDGRL